MARKQQPPQTAPDLPPEKAYTALNRQLEKLKQFNGRRYEQMKAEETEWQQFTEKLVIRSFGSDSPNHTNFRNALFAGEHYIQMWGERESDSTAEKFRSSATGVYSGAAELPIGARTRHR